MSKVADHIKLTADENGNIDSASVSADALTSVRVGVTDKDTGTVSMVEYKDEPVAKWTAEAQSSAVYHLISESSLVVKGVSVADKVIDRNARILAEELRLSILENSATVPRPQTTKERRQAIVADMRENGATESEIIDFLME